MLEGMAGSNIGVWTAHGEGKCLFPDEGVKSTILEQNLAPIRYEPRRAHLPRLSLNSGLDSGSARMHHARRA